VSGKPVILILIGALWPGNDSSGPNQSIKALCEGLSDAFEFRIISRDRPFGATKATAVPKVWQDYGFARQACLPVDRLGADGLIKLLRDTPHDLLVLNGYFDREFTLPTLIARRFGRGSSAPVLLSPRGEFSGGALSLKSGRKSAYSRLAGLMGLLRGVHIHATSDVEAQDIRAALPDAPITAVPNFRPLFPLPLFVARAENEPLRLVFLGRISQVKGLDIALDALTRCTVPAKLSIYGPVGDDAYWQACQAQIEALPAHVSAQWHGEISNDAAPAMLAQHDLFLTPSLSENFGHAIFESLASGTPVLIGDQTPWRHLAAQKAGHDLPVGDAAGLAAAMDHYAALPLGEQAAWRTGARAAAERWVADSPARDAMAALFHCLIERPAI
jgi:glycosyltransferase involved in cell wall biosynthesis